MVGVDPLSNAPVLCGDAFQEVVIHIEANAQREEGELLPHHPLYVLLDAAELDLTYRNTQEDVLPAEELICASLHQSDSP